MNDEPASLAPWRQLPPCALCGEPATRRMDCCGSELCEYDAGQHAERRMHEAGRAGSRSVRWTWRQWLHMQHGKAMRPFRPRVPAEVLEARRLERERQAAIIRETSGPPVPCPGVTGHRFDGPGGSVIISG